MQNSSSEISLSIVVPVYSGSDYLPKLVGEIEALRDRWSKADTNLVLSEAIFALDAPVDDSDRLLGELAADRPWLRRVNLSRNYGQHSATVAGILYSSSDWVATLDEDLQHRPDQLETLLAVVPADGMDIVYALPEQPVHGGGYRDRASRMVKSLIAALSGNRYVSSFNSFRLIRGDLARAAASICAQHTYFDVAVTWFTDRIATANVPMSDERYQVGKKSGYRLGMLIHHAKRLILTSDFRVLRVTTALSLVAFGASAVMAAWVLYARFLAEHAVAVQGWASLMVVVLGFGSISVFMLGLIAEFLHTSMLQLQGKPAFFVVDRSSDSQLAESLAKLETACRS